MGNINKLLAKRLKKAEAPSAKMTEMSKQSASGNLTSFAGIFSLSELSGHEKALLEEILETHATKKEYIAKDLQSLISITSEVKAINNQAAILHGERIKKAQTLFKSYQEGAFTAWLMATYGNRQTPYNLLQYYEFYEALPKALRPQIEAMPRQAIYTLASRNAPFEQKIAVVENYKGETKLELLNIIRELFPLSSEDKRKELPSETALENFRKAFSFLQKKKIRLNKQQKQEIASLISDLQDLIS
ncbi:MAG TPA: CT583 family protein [Parachlamydiaceae bacterium]|nr:CT583 family protein [Parachlamydiaceae bacterium]